jgi:hypothetical protein
MPQDAYALLVYAAFAIAVLILLDALIKSQRKLFVSKKYAHGEVTIELRNGMGEIAGVRVIDRLPADAELGALNGGKIYSSAEERSVRWNVPLLMPGERAVFRYGLRTSEKKLPGAEVKATQAREIRARSDGVHL